MLELAVINLKVTLVINLMITYLVLCLIIMLTINKRLYREL